eukprot:5796035-Alexandrium_andersonii.AAC.1
MSYCRCGNEPNSWSHTLHINPFGTTLLRNAGYTLRHAGHCNGNSTPVGQERNPVFSTYDVISGSHGGRFLCSQRV